MNDHDCSYIHHVEQLFSFIMWKVYASVGTTGLVKLPAELGLPVCIMQTDLTVERHPVIHMGCIARTGKDHILTHAVDGIQSSRGLCIPVRISGNDIVRNDIVTAIQSILDSERDRFQEIRRLVTRSQWKMMEALAKEGSVSQITSSAFLSKYKISSGPTALRNIKALMDKELVLVMTTDDGTSYSVYNVFLSRYLEMNR